MVELPMLLLLPLPLPELAREDNEPEELEGDIVGEVEILEGSEEKESNDSREGCCCCSPKLLAMWVLVSLYLPR